MKDWSKKELKGERNRVIFQIREELKAKLIEEVGKSRKEIDQRPEKVGVTGLDYEILGYNSALSDVIKIITNHQEI